MGPRRLIIIVGTHEKKKGKEVEIWRSQVRVLEGGEVRRIGDYSGW